MTEVEVYDPVSATWSERGFMPTARWGAAAAVLGTSIYVIGGQNTGNQNLSTAIVEQFDAITETWTSKTQMPTARWGAGAATINGLIYVAGGLYFVYPSPGPSSALEVYNPTDDTWSAKSPMPTARWDLGVASLNGKLYAIGGWEPVAGTVLQTVEEYDPAIDSWRTKSPMPTGRTGLVLIPFNGRIYAIGGSTNTAVVGTIEVYDPSVDSWSAVVP